MSVSYHIYNTDEGFEDMSKWESDHFKSVGSPKKVIKTIEQLFPLRELDWKHHENSQGQTPYIDSYSCLANKNFDRNEEYIELYLTVHKKGYVCEVTANKASPKLIQLLMNALDLKFVYVFESMELINPFEYEGNWIKVVEKH